MPDIDYDAFDPELRAYARLLPKGFALQRGLRAPRALMSLAGRVGRLHGAQVAVVTSDVTVRVHRRITALQRDPAMLWIHGGGTVMGTAAQEDRFCRKLANFTDISVVAVEHRLAPEYPYPTPLQDCYAALVWLRNQPWVDPDRIAVGGASAGGGLAAALAQLALARGEVRLALQLMVYPMLDDRTGALPDNQRRVMWSARDNQLAWGWYLADADPATAVPARCKDLTGLPPAWIGVGSRDLFYSECLNYADRLRAAGVPAHLEVADGAFHAFDLLAANTSVSQRFFAAQCRAVRSALFDDGPRN